MEIASKMKAVEMVVIAAHVTRDALFLLHWVHFIADYTFK